MSGGFSPFALALVLLRLAGLWLTAAWFLDWLAPVAKLVRHMVVGNWESVGNSWLASIFPRFFYPGLWYDNPYTTLVNLCTIAAGLYLLLGGRALAAFLVRGTHLRGCHKCGYSLAGLKTGRCPECGESATQAAS